MDHIEASNITIRLQCDNAGLQFLTYITDSDGMQVEFTEVATTAEVNTVWHMAVK